MTTVSVSLAIGDRRACVVRLGYSPQPPQKVDGGERSSQATG